MGSEKKNKKKQKTTAEVVHNNGRGGGKIITDPRFSSLHSDPRFREAPRKKSKVAIDSRFTRVFTDKIFAPSKAGIDKRGKQKKDSSGNKLRHYYHLEDDEEEERRERGKEVELKKKENVESEDEEDEEEEEESESEESESEDEGGLRENEELKKKASKLKSKFEDSESESESESESGEEENEDEDEDEDDQEGYESDSDDASTSTTDTDEEDGDYLEEDDTFMQPQEDVPMIDKETHRLAVVNMDWTQVKAEDLYVLLSSFLPKGGQIKSVAIYPTEFGLKRMEEEAVRGPVGLFDSDKESDGDDDDDEEEEEINEKKLRAYELTRLRYYNAVVECDSVATADYLYKTCDGVEFERSSVKLDLRFIPDSIEFKHPPRDVATEAPANYEGLDFQNRALQMSKVNVSWDDDEPQREKALKRKFNDYQLAELELQEFLASDVSETDDDVEADNDEEDKSSKKHRMEERYRVLLKPGNDDEEDGQDMEVTFNPGLEDLSKRILEKKDKKSETVWEASLKKMKEKKKARKNKSKDSSDDESSDTDQEPTEQPDDFFIDESSDKGSKGAGKKAKKGKANPETTREAEASRAELELLLADDNGGDPSLKGYNLKRKKAKGKNGNEVVDEDKIPTVDYDDPRFSALFKSPHFALDPTDPHYKRSAAYIRQVAQKQSKSDPTRQETPSQAQSSKTEDGDEHVHLDIQSDYLSQKKQKLEISSLVRSVKMKSKQISVPSNTKVSGSQPPKKKRK